VVAERAGALVARGGGDLDYSAIAGEQAYRR
jgi:hypothetical protein